jgi:hypothetical protein
VEQLVNGFYVAGVESAAVTVSLPGTGQTTGGGWLNEPNIGTRSNYGFTVKRLKNGAIQGNSVYIYRKTVGANEVKYGTGYLPAGAYNWQVKSNSWQGGGLSMNRVTGVAYSLGGNYNYRVDVTDFGEPGSKPATTPDTYGIKVWSSTSGTYYQLYNPPTPPNSQTFPQLPINGGNIQVRP